MATVEIYDVPSGLVGVTLDVYVDKTYSILSGYDDIAVVEARPTLYIATINGLSGLHSLNVKDNAGDTLQNAWVWLSPTGIIRSYPSPEAAISAHDIETVPTPSGGGTTEETDETEILRETRRNLQIAYRDASANPQPNYVVNGETYNWASYLEMLGRQLKVINDQLALVDEDLQFETVVRGRT